MYTSNSILKRASFLLISLGLLICSCSKKEGCMDPSSNNYNPEATHDDGSCNYDKSVPSVYSFDNVNYSGQTVRLLLLKDLVDLIEQAKTKTVTASELVALYENTEGKYTSIATGKKLSDKCRADADISVRNWFDQIESLSSNGGGYLTADSLDLKQMVEKTLMGAVFFYQAADNYLKNISNQDNSTVITGDGTKMEHHWDEAFGYFGAARDYNSYTDLEIIAPGQKDSNSDGIIDPKSEKCFYFAVTAAKRDDNSKAFAFSSQSNFSKDLFDAWLTGRTAIINKQYQKRDDNKYALLLTWEKIIASTVLHYINEVSADLTNNASATDLSKHWAEMKAYYGMIKYHSSNKMATDFTLVDAYLGNKPSDLVNNTANLTNAAAKIKQAYGFSDEQVAKW